MKKHTLKTLQFAAFLSIVSFMSVQESQAVYNINCPAPNAIGLEKIKGQIHITGYTNGQQGNPVKLVSVRYYPGIDPKILRQFHNTGAEILYIGGHHPSFGSLMCSYTNLNAHAPHNLQFLTIR